MRQIVPSREHEQPGEDREPGPESQFLHARRHRPATQGFHRVEDEMAAIEDAVRKSEAARTKLRLDEIRTLREASATLTPEQREKWRSSRAAMHAEWEGHGVQQREAGS